MVILQLFWEFFKAGLFAIGGGLATLPFLTDISARTGWFTTNDLADMVAVSESTPGPLGINMATYVGFKTAGIPGGIIATLGLIAPSIIIILIILHILKKFKDSPIIERVFFGLRPASTGLIAAAGLGVARICMLNPVADLHLPEGLLTLINWKMVLLAVLLYIGIKKFNKHPILYVGIAAVCGIVFSL